MKTTANLKPKTTRTTRTTATLIACFAVTSLLLAGNGFCEDKLVVKDGAGDPTFTVQDSGEVFSATKLGVGSTFGYNLGVTDNSEFVAGFSSVGGIHYRYGTGANAGTNWFSLRARGTKTLPEAVIAGDLLGRFNFRGYSAAAGTFKDGAWLGVKVDGAPDTAGDTTDMPGKIIFNTSPDGSSTPVERMAIYSDGQVGINNLQGTYTNGSAYVCVDNNGELFASETGCP